MMKNHVVQFPPRTSLKARNGLGINPDVDRVVIEEPTKYGHRRLGGLHARLILASAAGTPRQSIIKIPKRPRQPTKKVANGHRRGQAPCMGMAGGASRHHAEILLY